MPAGAYASPRACCGRRARAGPGSEQYTKDQGIIVTYVAKVKPPHTLRPPTPRPPARPPSSPAQTRAVRAAWVT